MLDDGAPLDLKVELLRARLELDDLPELPVERVAAEQDVELLGVLIGDEIVGAGGEIADHEPKRSLALLQEHSAIVVVGVRAARGAFVVDLLWLIWLNEYSRCHFRSDLSTSRV